MGVPLCLVTAGKLLASYFYFPEGAILCQQEKCAIPPTAQGRGFPYGGINELDKLNRIVTAYLEFAESQAMNRKPMYMEDWIGKLDDFLSLSDREVLDHAGKVSHDNAVAKARREYERFSAKRRKLPSPVERHFEEAVNGVKQLEKQRRRRPKTKSIKKKSKNNKKQ